MNGAGQNGDLAALPDEAPLPNHLAGGDHVLVAVLVYDDGCRNGVGRTTVLNQHRPADRALVIGDRNVGAPNLLRLWLDDFVHAVGERHMRLPIVVGISTCDGLTARCMSDEQSDGKNKCVTTEHRSNLRWTPECCKQACCPELPGGKFLENVLFRYGETTNFDCQWVERTSSGAGVAPAESSAFSRRTVTPTTAKHSYCLIGFLSRTKANQCDRHSEYHEEPAY